MQGIDSSEYVADPKRITKRIGDIYFLDEIGRGAFAIVYKGRDGKGNEVAIKEIPRRILNDKLLESLKQEIEILKSINNPNIIKLLGVKKSTKNFYLIMEYCNGGDLQKFLRLHKRLEEHVAQNIIWQVSNGLKELSENRILHRDLKLSNLLVSYKDGSFSVKIADFGFAKALSSTEDAQTFCGTAPNMAPEVLMGNRYNEKADLWSMGTIIFQLLAGHPPFDGKNPVQVLQSIMRGLYAYPADVQITKLCKGLVQSLLQVDAERRMSWEEYFAHAFVKTEPREYLANLRKLYGEDYGQRSPLEVAHTINNTNVNKERHVEKSEVMPKDKSEHNDKELKEPTTAADNPKPCPVAHPKEEHKTPKEPDPVMKEYDFVEHEEAKVCVPDHDSPKMPLPSTPPVFNAQSSSLSNTGLINLFQTAARTLLTQSETFAQYLKDNKEAHSVNKYEKIEFFMLVSILSRIQTLISLLNKPERKHKGKPAVIYVDESNDQKLIVELSEEHLDSLIRSKEAKAYRIPLGRSYLQLIESLKASAFLLQEISSFASLDSAIDNILYVVDQVQIEDQLQNFPQMKNRLAQCIVMLDIVVEEYCLFAEDKVFPKNWSRFIKSYNKAKVNRSAARDVRYVLYLRSLLEAKLKSLEEKHC